MCTDDCKRKGRGRWNNKQKWVLVYLSFPSFWPPCTLLQSSSCTTKDLECLLQSSCACTPTAAFVYKILKLFLVFFLQYFVNYDKIFCQGLVFVSVCLSVSWCILGRGHALLSAADCLIWLTCFKSIHLLAVFKPWFFSHSLPDCSVCLCDFSQPAFRLPCPTSKPLTQLRQHTVPLACLVSSLYLPLVSRWLFASYLICALLLGPKLCLVTTNISDRHLIFGFWVIFFRVFWHNCHSLKHCMLKVKTISKCNLRPLLHVPLCGALSSNNGSVYTWSHFYSFYCSDSYPFPLGHVNVSLLKEYKSNPIQPTLYANSLEFMPMKATEMSCTLFIIC